MKQAKCCSLNDIKDAPCTLWTYALLKNETVYMNLGHISYLLSPLSMLLLSRHVNMHTFVCMRMGLCMFVYIYINIHICICLVWYMPMYVSLLFCIYRMYYLRVLCPMQLIFNLGNPRVPIDHCSWRRVTSLLTIISVDGEWRPLFSDEYA